MLFPDPGPELADAAVLVRSTYVICSIISIGLEMPPDRKAVPDLVDMALDRNR